MNFLRINAEQLLFEFQNIQYSYNVNARYFVSFVFIFQPKKSALLRITTVQWFSSLYMYLWKSDIQNSQSGIIRHVSTSYDVMGVLLKVVISS